MAIPFDLPIPTTLDEVVTKNRELYEIRLATQDEIDALRGEIDAPTGAEKDVMCDWRLIAIRDRRQLIAQLVLLGDVWGKPTIRCTSEVLVISPNKQRIRTRNSIYGLTRAGEGEPPQIHLLHLCSTLHGWGLGQILGAIEVW